MKERDASVYRILCAAAENGDPCPTNRGIGLEIKISPGKVGSVFSRLSSDGFITIKRPRPTTAARIVKICATGKSTAITKPQVNRTPASRKTQLPLVEQDQINWPDYSKHNVRTKFVQVVK